MNPKKFFGVGISRALGLALATAAMSLGCAGSGISAARRFGEPIASPRRIATAPILERSAGSGASRGDGSENRETGAVTIYGVEWCGPCHQAADFLSSRGVQYVERNIEGDEGAQREMRAKLSRAGLPAGAIPVIDVKGMILVGFNPQAVDRALTRPL